MKKASDIHQGLFCIENKDMRGIGYVMLALLPKGRVLQYSFFIIIGLKQ